MSADDLHADCIRFDVERGADPNDLTKEQKLTLIGAAVRATRAVVVKGDLVGDHVYALMDAIEALPTPGERYSGVVLVVGTLLDLPGAVVAAPTAS